MVMKYSLTDWSLLAVSLETIHKVSIKIRQSLTISCWHSCWCSLSSFVLLADDVLGLVWQSAEYRLQDAASSSSTIRNNFSGFGRSL